MNNAILFSNDPPETWKKVKTSYYHFLKASRVLLKCHPILQVASYSESEFRTIYPLLLQIEACVYSGDLAYEEEQKKGNICTEPTWKQNIANLLKSYEFYDSEIRQALDDLETYFSRESQLLLGKIDLREQSILDILYIRSSDIYLLLRLAYKIKNIPYNEDFFRILKPWLALEEIRDDLASYREDIANKSFNTLRLFARLYGRERAARKLGETRRKLVNRGMEGLKKADKGSLIQFWLVLLELTPRKPFILLLLYLIPRFLLVYGARLLLTGNEEKQYGVIPQVIDEPSEDSNITGKETIVGTL